MPSFGKDIQAITSSEEKLIDGLLPEGEPSRVPYRGELTSQYQRAEATEGCNQLVRTLGEAAQQEQNLNLEMWTRDTAYQNYQNVSLLSGGVRQALQSLQVSMDAGELSKITVEESMELARKLVQALAAPPEDIRGIVLALPAGRG